MRILVCRPTFFDVRYVINPWMEGQIGRVERGRAERQWNALMDRIAGLASLVEIEPAPGCPDMCFTANAGLVSEGRALPGRFRMPERRGEEAPYRAFFAQHGFASEATGESSPRFDEIASYIAPPARTNAEAAFEGEGDALFQPGEALVWAGHGPRSVRESHVSIARLFGVEVVSLRLVDPRFYHLDTCFAPLAGGRVVYAPTAFDLPSRRAIESRIPPERRIAVEAADALAFACNLLPLGDRIFLNDASPHLARALAAWGYETCIQPVDEFLKAGGGVKCLTLRLEQESERKRAPQLIRAKG